MAQAIQEKVRKTNERVEADFSKITTKIHRFPQGLRGIGGTSGRYIVPTVVAIGPYHHGSPHLQEMEEVKHAAAHYLCAQSGHSVEDVYGKVLSVSGEARACYADNAFPDFTVDDFAAMMFLDGCFLLHYIASDTDSALLLNRMTLSTGPCILRDIFLLENQLPWLVLEALIAVTYIDYISVFGFIINSMSEVCSSSICKVQLSEDELIKSYRPPHLLGLLRYYMVGSMSSPEDDGSALTCFASSATELAEMGVKLTTSNKMSFADMSVQKGFLTGELSLAPLFLNEHTASSVVNMAALEACTSTTFPSDGYTICSYLSVLAMLIDREEDAQELRAKHIVHSFFSNKQMVDYFKGLALHLRLGHRYFVIVNEIDEYKRHRPVRIVVHKFFYHNFKTIAALLSIAGVLVGIFKTLMSLKNQS